MYPRRLGAGRRGAAPSLRPVTRSARRHKGNTKREGRACRVRWGDGRRRGAAATSTKREGRACRVRWGGRTPTGCGRDKYETGGTRLSRPMGGTNADGVRPRQARPSRVLDLYDNPIISRPLSIRSFPVPLQWMKQCASQPQNPLRVPVCSVLTGRRPRNRPAPPLHGRNKLRPSRRPPSAIRHREGRNSLRPFIASRASEATPL